MALNNQHVESWVKAVAERLQPDKVIWINGEESEHREICDKLVSQNSLVPLNHKDYPNSFWGISDPNDVARVEDRTFICSRRQRDAGPTNNWCDPKEMYARLDALMEGCMQGRTMYVVPYLMGPDNSPYSRVGFEITDSEYVVANMRIMARIGKVALENLREDSPNFVRGVHSMGKLDPEERYICHFPEDRTIISYSSNYGGNVLLGKKCFALRIASALGRDEGWMAEHMLILGITNPEGRKHYITAAFPSACGKTNLAMLIPPKQYLELGWKVETVGDDIAWLNYGPDGRLYAINPEYGFFGVAPGTSDKTNKNAMATLRKGNTIFTNTALDLDNMVPWWEGMSEPPKRVRDWLGNDWTPSSGKKAAHPNSRFTTPAAQCPSIDGDWESSSGVPISAIIFGGRRAKVAPLVYEARDWQHGTFLGVTMASETTAAASGKVGELRRDPMAMLPFIGYHAGDYFKHWLDIGKRAGAKLPKIYHVNWFRTDSSGAFIWPGFGDNMRVLEWILGRVDGKLPARETALGYMPNVADLNCQNLNVSPEALEDLIGFDPQDWRSEIQSQKQFFEKIGDPMPRELWEEHEALARRLGFEKSIANL